MLRGKEPCFVLIDIKLTRVYPQPVCGYVGQEILHNIPMDRRSGGWVHPQNMPVAWTAVRMEVTFWWTNLLFCCHGSMFAKTSLRADRCVGVLSQRSQSSLTMPSGVRDQQRLDL